MKKNDLCSMFVTFQTCDLNILRQAVNFFLHYIDSSKQTKILR